MVAAEKSEEETNHLVGRRTNRGGRDKGKVSMYIELEG